MISEAFYPTLKERSPIRLTSDEGVGLEISGNISVKDTFL